MFRTHLIASETPATTHEMRTPARTFCLSLIFALATSSTLVAQTESPQPQKDLQQSCLAFVQAFYDWYIPPWLTRNLESTATLERWDKSRDPLKFKAQLFSPELVRRLKEDYAAQAKVEGEIVGIDFNPYIGGNAGPLGRYVVGKLTRKGEGYRVKVYCIASGKKDKEPSVEAELVFKEDRWLFVNFRYAEGKEGDDLMSILKLLREQR